MVFDVFKKSLLMLVAIFLSVTPLLSVYANDFTEEKVTAQIIKTEEKVNINIADISQLRKLNGIGEKKAQAIIDFRNSNGKFNSVNDLLAVPGIGQTLLDKNIDIISVD